MSKIGKIPVIIKEGVTVSFTDNRISVAGPKGNLFFDIPKGIKAEVKENEIIVLQDKGTEEKTNALFGLTRAMIANLVKGVTDGFEKKLELSGVGYRAQAAGSTLTLSLGFSHPVIIKAKDGITFAVDENVITISGINKEEILKFPMLSIEEVP